jgi:hypothetical protein
MKSSDKYSIDGSELTDQSKNTSNGIKKLTKSVASGTIEQV